MIKFFLYLVLTVFLSSHLYSQNIDFKLYSGIAKASKFKDVPLEIGLEYSPLDWLSVFAGYEKFDDAFKEFDGDHFYPIDGMGAYRHFSYSLFKFGVNYYPLKIKRHAVSIGIFAGYGQLSMNRIKHIAYHELKNIGSESDPTIAYNVELVLGDYQRNLPGVGISLAYDYEILHDRLSIGLKFDHMTFTYEESQKIVVPKINSMKLCLGINL